MFRSEGDIIYAANAARDLANLVTAYLTLYKRYVNDLDGLRIPSEPYTVVFLPQSTEGKLHVKLVYEQVISHSTPIYADNGGYEEPEFGSYGSRGIVDYETTYSTQNVDKAIVIPIANLLQSKEQMEAGLKAFADGKRKELLEKERQSKIARHREAIRQLEEESK